MIASSFAAIFDTLMSSEVAERFDLEIAGITLRNVPVLCGVPDTEGDYGQVRVGEDRRRFEVRCADLVAANQPLTPRRGDLLRQPGYGNFYEIQSTPWKDQLGLVWIFDAWRRADPI